MGFFNFFNKNNSKNVAKDRLKLVLIHDRALISPRMIEDMKNELVAVISKYVDVDLDTLNIEISDNDKTSRQSALIASVPIKTSKN